MSVQEEERGKEKGAGELGRQGERQCMHMKFIRDEHCWCVHVWDGASI